MKADVLNLQYLEKVFKESEGTGPNKWENIFYRKWGFCARSGFAAPGCGLMG